MPLGHNLNSILNLESILLNHLLLYPQNLIISAGHFTLFFNHKYSTYLRITSKATKAFRKMFLSLSFIKLIHRREKMLEKIRWVFVM